MTEGRDMSPPLAGFAQGILAVLICFGVASFIGIPLDDWFYFGLFMVNFVYRAYVESRDK